jgi:Protein of unknown function (DUF4089)
VQSSQRTRDERDSRQDERRICDDEAVTQANDSSLDAYVRTALALQGYRFDEAQIAEIVAQFSRLEAIAQTILQWPLPFASEAAPVFRP